MSSELPLDPFRKSEALVREPPLLPAVSEPRGIVSGPTVGRGELALWLPFAPSLPSAPPSPASPLAELSPASLPLEL